MTQRLARGVFEHIDTRDRHTRDLLIMPYDIVGFSNDLKG